MPGLQIETFGLVQNRRMILPNPSLQMGGHFPSMPVPDDMFSNCGMMLHPMSVEVFREVHILLLQPFPETLLL